LLVTCLLHLGGTFLVRVRFFERPSFVRVTSSNSDNHKGTQMFLLNKELSTYDDLEHI
jgi:hypothetical protein